MQPEAGADARCMQIKAWCYYESRLLGAHHGLLSSYALEVLVLHICNVYYATVTTPLQVTTTPPPTHRQPLLLGACPHTRQLSVSSGIRASEAEVWVR